MKRKEFQPFTLHDASTLLNSGDETTSNAYISDNMALVSEAVPTILLHMQERPLQLKESRILLLRKGFARASFNLLEHNIQVNDLVFVASGSTTIVHEYAHDARVSVVSLSDELLALVLGNHLPKAFDGRERDFILHLKAEEKDLLVGMIEMMWQINNNEPHSSQALLSLLAAFFWQVDFFWNNKQEELAKHISHEQKVFRDFITLVNLHAATEHGIAFYASKLCLSPRYMSFIVKKQSGQSAKQWIDKALISAIKVGLKHSDKQVRELSDEMKFPNPSFFCKYFKRLTGQTPQQFRDG